MPECMLGYSCVDDAGTPIEPCVVGHSGDRTTQLRYYEGLDIGSRNLGLLPPASWPGGGGVIIAANTTRRLPAG